MAGSHALGWDEVGLLMMSFFMPLFGPWGEASSSKPVVTPSKCNHSGGVACMCGQPDHVVCNNTHLKNSGVHAHLGVQRQVEDKHFTML